MRCEIDEEAVCLRGREVCEMLKLLSGRGPLIYRTIGRKTEVIVSVYSGFPRDDLLPEYWRFTTQVSGIRASYLERWKPTDEKRKRFYIERAYLHLYRRRPYEDEESEILALHCDPNEPDDSGSARHAVYKRGPHIHVTASDQPLPHSHIALNYPHVDDVVSSFNNLRAALRSGVVMVREQVLDVIDARGL